MRVQPGARRDALLARLASGEWKVCVSAPPADGRANEAVMELLSDLLGVKRRQIKLLRGAASRSKVLEVNGVSAEAAASRLAAALPETGGKGEPGDQDGD